MSKIFHATLCGRAEVPPVKTRACGEFDAKLSHCGKKLKFILRVNCIKGFTQAHLHLGAVGRNGPIVVTLFGPTKNGITTCEGIVTGTIRARDLEGPLKNKSICKLVSLIKKGKIYVNVHTERHPAGEIRGQVRRRRRRRDCCCF